MSLRFVDCFQKIKRGNPLFVFFVFSLTAHLPLASTSLTSAALLKESEKTGLDRRVLTKSLTEFQKALKIGSIKTPKLARRSNGEISRYSSTHSSEYVRVNQKNYLIIVDFRLPYSQPRLFIVDLAKEKILPFIVAHGEGSDPSEKGIVEVTSNIKESHMSSQGIFITDEKYIGKHQHSVRLVGINRGVNDNAYARNIVIHKENYVLSGGLSEGCFVLSPKDMKWVFSNYKIQDGAFMYVVGPTRDRRTASIKRKNH